MGISRLKRLLSDALALALETQYIEKMGAELFLGFDLYEQCGVSRKYTINRKDAADCLVIYAFNNGEETKLLEEFFRIAKDGVRSDKISSSYVSRVYNELLNSKMAYDPVSGRVYYRDAAGGETDWGILEDGEIYSFCFMSIDICDNSSLSRRYSTDDIKETYRHFKNAVAKATERRGGKIWSWEGDGGLIAFHMGDMTRDALMAALEIYNMLSLINLTVSSLGENLLVRMALHQGRATYKRQTNAIVSESIQYTHELEKQFTEPMTLSISDNAFSHLNSQLRNYFQKVVTEGREFYTAKLPIRNR